jgi:two-component system LytT family response regulator
VIRALIVDDEPLAREGLRMRLQRESDIELVGEARGADEAVEMITRLRPDLVLLDVQMPGGDGFEVLERIAGEHLPEIVFVTAFEEHAVRAFEVNALDYLLKPVEEERFGQALARARGELALGAERRSGHRLASLLEGMPGSSAAGRSLQRFVARDRGRYVLVRVDQVRWIKAEGNYVALHTGRGSYLVRGSLRELEARLDPQRFARIHRSAIVNLDVVDSVVPTDAGDFQVVLDDGARIPMSRTYRERVLR